MAENASAGELGGTGMFDGDLGRELKMQNLQIEEITQ